MKYKWYAVTTVLIPLFLTVGLAMQKQSKPTVLQTTIGGDPQTKAYVLDDKTPTVIHSLKVTNHTDSLYISSIHDPNVLFTLINPRGEVTSPRNIGQGNYIHTNLNKGKRLEEIGIGKPMPGDWKISYSLEEGTSRRAIIQTVITGSDSLTAKVIVDYTQIEGRAFPVSVAVVRDSTPVKNASVKLIFTNWSTQKETIMAAKDNGQQDEGDFRVGDGLYSAYIKSLSPAFYLVTAEIKLPDGTEYATSNFFSVEDFTALLAGTATDDGLDDDGDGKIDRIVLHFPVKRVERAGRYVIDAVLRGTNGKLIQTDDAVVNLKSDTKSANIFFDTKELSEIIGVDGPYQIEQVQLLWDPEDVETRPGTHTAQVLGTIGQTKPYKLTDFQGVVIKSGRYLGDKGIDSNNDGQPDKIEVSFEIISTFELPVSWNASLVPIGGLASDLAPPNAKNQGVLKPGINKLSLTFDIRDYKFNHVDGPYTLIGLSFMPHGRWPSVYLNKGYDQLYDIAYPFGKTRNYMFK